MPASGGLLREGAVVALRGAGGRVYRVRRPAGESAASPRGGDEDDAAAPVLELGPASTADGGGYAALEDPACHLVVVARGQFFGFYSEHAYGRYLQGARHLSSPHARIAFYSRLCGVWEQWEVRHIRGAGPSAVELSPRRLPQAKLKVDLLFVPDSLLSSPRRASPPPALRYADDDDERHRVNRIEYDAAPVPPARLPAARSPRRWRGAPRA